MCLCCSERAWLELCVRVVRLQTDVYITVNLIWSCWIDVYIAVSMIWSCWIDVYIAVSMTWSCWIDVDIAVSMTWSCWSCAFTNWCLHCSEHNLELLELCVYKLMFTLQWAWPGVVGEMFTLQWAWPGVVGAVAVDRTEVEWCVLSTADCFGLRHCGLLPGNRGRRAGQGEVAWSQGQPLLHTPSSNFWPTPSSPTSLL